MPVRSTDIFKPSPWQMTFGERAALEGILSQLKPTLAIEIGTAEGGSIRRLSTHSEQVHSLDLVKPQPAVEALSNVTVHTGDSHALLPDLLGHLAAERANVGFVLVDGDHTADGVERDLRDLIDSDAIRHTVILAHDTLNDEVREGLRRVDFASEPKIVFSDLDFVGGHLSKGGPYHLQPWGGLGLIVVDEGSEAWGSPGGKDETLYDLFEFAAPVRDRLVAEGK